MLLHPRLRLAMGEGMDSEFSELVVDSKFLEHFCILHLYIYLLYCFVFRHVKVFVK